MDDAETALHSLFLNSRFSIQLMAIEIQTEMFSLLNALSENRLSREGIKRLEQLVISSREARQMYVRYINLHGTLSWDARASESCTTPKANGDPRAEGRRRAVSGPSPISASPARPERWSVARVGRLAAVAAIFLFVSILWLTKQAAPSVVATVEKPPARPEVLDPPASLHGETSPVPASTGAFAPRSNLATATLPAPVSTPVPSAEDVSDLTPSQPREVAVTGNPPEEKSAAFDAIIPAPTSDFEIVSQINVLIEKKWAESGAQPAPLAEDPEWLRRVYLDLVGHIPDRGSLNLYLSDHRPNKRRLVVDSLLQTPDYARNLTTVWMNLLVGRSTERPINRDALARFLRHQFHENRPWTETVSKLVAAEGDCNEVGEANFLLAHLNNQAVPATAVTTRIFLCRQVQCTQCHRHPDSKHGGSMADFWELNSFFQQASVVENTKYDPATGRTEVVSRSLVDKPVGGPMFFDDLSGLMRVAYPKFSGHEVDPDPSVKRRQELARLMTTVDRQELAAALVNRTWNHFFGQGLVNPIDDMGPHTPCAHPELLKVLADAVVASGFDVQRLNRWIVMSRAYQLSSAAVESSSNDQLADDDTPLFNRMKLKPLSAEQMFDSLLVATAANYVGATDWEQAENQRQTWMKQFYVATENEENCDASRFDGTFSQTLMMMNGDLVQKAVSNRPGTVLYEITCSKMDDQERVQQLCRAALSRDPRRSELNAFQSAFKRRGDGKKTDATAFEDLFWSYLNSAEFSVNH